MYISWFRYGVEYLGMMNGRADVDFDGEVERFTIHHILCFDPVRRRMSVIVEDSKGEKISEHNVSNNLVSKSNY